MLSLRSRWTTLFFGFIFLLLAISRSPADSPTTKPDLPDYATVETAKTTQIVRVSASAAGQTGHFGIQAEGSAAGVTISAVEPESPAAKAGLLKGDVVVSLGGIPVTTASGLRDLGQATPPGQTVNISITRKDKPTELKMTAIALSRPMKLTDLGGGPGPRRRFNSPDDVLTSLARKQVLKLAVVGIDFADTKHNEKITPENWVSSFFSSKAYADKNATGQAVYGSVNDYFTEQSCGALHVDGKMLGWVELAKKRGQYTNASSTPDRNPLLTDAVEKLLTRDGSRALADYDAVIFIYAGQRVTTNRGGIYYPHAGSINYRYGRLPCVVIPEGGDRMTPITPVCHELGRLLGLPDLAARPDAPTSEGLGPWCGMSTQMTTGRPQHFSAWCKEQLGWITPTVIDPTIQQKLVLSPIEESSKECFKILIRRDGSEYLLLENRQQTGFDASLPAGGLLIWRVVENRPSLEASHGVAGAPGAQAFLTMVPFPSLSNNSFTPQTIPSSKSQLGGGLPVHITDIHRIADGRIAFSIGYDLE